MAGRGSYSTSMREGFFGRVGIDGGDGGHLFPTKRTVSSASRGTSRTMRPTRMPAVSLPVITAGLPPD